MRTLLSIILIHIFIFSQEDFETKMSFNFRERSNLRMMNDNMNTFQELRSRIGLTTHAYDNITLFFQIQDSRIYGSEPSTLSSINNLDLHQGYAIIDHIFDSNFYYKFGRMEMAYANQRIIGSVGWHNTGRSFDGNILGYENDDFKIDFFNHNTNETNRFNDDSLDVIFNGTHLSYNVSKTLTAEAFFYSLEKKNSHDNLHTSGVFIKGKVLDNLTYESMFATQFGSQTKQIDYDATYFSIKTTFNINEESSISAMYEMLSGDDGKDPSKNKTFTPIFGTNHKFNGYMDYFYVGPHKVNTNGLNDLAISLKFSTLSIDYHMFSTNEKVFDVNSKALNSNIGSEIDIQYVYNYNSQLDFTIGSAFFIFNEDFENSSQTNDMYYYTMLILKL